LAILIFTIHQCWL